MKKNEDDKEIHQPQYGIHKESRLRKIRMVVCSIGMTLLLIALILVMIKFFCQK